MFRSKVPLPLSILAHQQEMAAFRAHYKAEFASEEGRRPAEAFPHHNVFPLLRPFLVLPLETLKQNRRH